MLLSNIILVTNSDSAACASLNLELSAAFPEHPLSEARFHLMPECLGVPLQNLTLVRTEFRSKTQHHHDVNHAFYCCLFEFFVSAPIYQFELQNRTLTNLNCIAILRTIGSEEIISTMLLWGQNRSLSDIAFQILTPKYADRPCQKKIVATL